MNNQTNVIISVIIPVYGVEKFIERCARSLFEQTMTEGIEFIFVNDCTPDNSIGVLKHILAQYPYREQQTIIIEQPTNLGPDFARKTGIANASGRYIAFCDSDDWIEKNAYQLIVEKAVSEDLDMVICNDYVMNSAGVEHIRLAIPSGIISSEYAIKHLLNGRFAGGIVQKIVKREFYETELILPASNIGEDLVMSVQLCYSCKKIGYIAEPIYHYLFNQDSLSRKFTEQDVIKRSYDYAKNIDIIIDYLKHTGIYDRNKYDISTLMLRCREYIVPYIERHYDLWKSIYPELDTWEYFRRMPFKMKIKYLIIRLHLYKLYPLLQKLSRLLKSR